MAEYKMRKREVIVRTIAGFVFFWGWVFVVTTTLVLIFKHEIDYSIEPTNDANA